MSSKPSKQGVEELVADLTALRTLRDEIADIESKLPRLKRAREEYALLHHAVAHRLRSMDVHTDGNGGWEDRVVWFLLELQRQAQEQVSP
ncbi:MAG TPA: hypothetical protein VG963_07565 [Polyangiaceae bacterium]|nr:hypothetical protein [Polyangiaceae bacterium]